MLLLLLLVTPLVNAGYDSWPSPSPSPSPSPCPCTCTLPDPLEPVNCTECLNGMWYGLLSTDGNETCYSEIRITNCNNTIDLCTTEITKNGCGQTYCGTATLCSNTLTYTYPCYPDWDEDWVILSTDCKNYVIWAVCETGSCEPTYYIEFSCQNPSDCTIKQVQDDACKLGLNYTSFYNICSNC